MRIFFSIFILLFINYSLAIAKEKKLETKMIDANKSVSSWIDSSANSIDLTLTGKRFTKKINKSKAIISQETAWSETDGASARINFNLNLRLPNLEEKYKIIFSNYNSREQDRSYFSRRFANSGPSQPNYGTSVSFFQQLGKISSTFQPRIQLEDPLETNYVFSFESGWEGEVYSVDFDLELFADSKKGTGEFFSVKIEKSSNNWTYSFLFEEEYQDFKNLFTTREGVSIGQKLNQKMGLTYSLAIDSMSRPSFHLSGISVGPVFSQIIYRNVLKYWVAITQTFDEKYRFKGMTTSTLTFDFIF